MTPLSPAAAQVLRGAETKPWSRMRREEANGVFVYDEHDAWIIQRGWKADDRID